MIKYQVESVNKKVIEGKEGERTKSILTIELESLSTIQKMWKLKHCDNQYPK